jgi:peptide alpha-N-acetyltransferase
MLDKGVPSTFANLKHLYSNDSKKEILPAIVQQYIDSDKSSTNGEPKRNGDTSKGASAAFYFLAQHYNFYLSRDLDKAMDNVEKAIQLEPNSVDFHMTKARIWKHCGNTKKASEIMDQARTLDIRDRHINTKAAKYQLRNDEIEAAIKTMGMFTRAETVGGPLADLHDMQCMWFLTEDGQSYARQGKRGLALKRFTSVYNVFDVWQEDQFDFHSFSLRKGQIRAYVEMMRWEDHLRDHPFYSRAALSAIEIYLQIHDEPLSNGTNGSAESNGDDASERKKAVKKARKEAQKAEREAAAKKNESNRPTKEMDVEAKKKDDDPDGVKLASTTEPLSDAMKFLAPLLQFSPMRVDAQIAGFEVYVRRSKSHSYHSGLLMLMRSPEKYLLALKCLLAAAAIDKEHPKVHEQVVRFKVVMDKDMDGTPPKSLEVIKSEFNILPAAMSLTQYNDEYLAKHKDSAKSTLSALRVRAFLSTESASSCEKEIASVIKLPSITMEEAVEAFELLKSWQSSEAAPFKSSAAAKWPKATIFSLST